MSAASGLALSCPHSLRHLSAGSALSVGDDQFLPIMSGLRGDLPGTAAVRLYSSQGSL